MSNLNSMIDRLNKLNSAVERKPEQPAENKSDAADASSSSKILKEFLSKNALVIKNADSAPESQNDISAQKALSAFIGASFSNNGKALIPGIITENPDKHKSSEKHDHSKKPTQAFTAVSAAPTPALCWKCEAVLDGKAEHGPNPAGNGAGAGAGNSPGANGNGNGNGSNVSGNGTSANSTNVAGSNGAGVNGSGNGTNGNAAKTSSETWKPALLDTKSKPVPQPEPVQTSENPDAKPLSGNAKAVLQNAGSDTGANSKQAPSFLNAANVLGAVFKAASAAVSPGAKASEASKSTSEPQVKTPQPEKEFDSKDNAKGATPSSSAPTANASSAPTGSDQGTGTAANPPASQTPLPAFAWFKHTQTIESALRINDVHYADTVLSILFDVSTSLNADAGVKARLISLLARIRMDKKQYAEAETDLRNTLAVLDGTPHAKSISAAHCWHALAQSLFFQKKLENAEVAKEKAVAIAEACLGPKDPQTIFFKQALNS